MYPVEYEKDSLSVVLVLAEPIDDRVDAVDHRDLQAVKLGENRQLDGATPGVRLEDPLAVLGVGSTQKRFRVFLWVGRHRVGYDLPHEVGATRVDPS